MAMKMYPLAFLLLIVPIAIGFAYVSEQSPAAPSSTQQPEKMSPQKREMSGRANVFFKSDDNGKTWEETSEVPADMELSETGRTMVQSAGVMIATGQQGIKRSADEGKTWQWVISEGGVGIDVATINGGFAAITFNTESNTRRIRTSYDGGITWQAIDEGLQSPYFQTPISKMFTQPNQANAQLPEEAFITSIVEVKGQFFCGHPKGVFRSADNGKKWELLLSSIEGKVYQLYVVDNVMYAIPRNAGC
jgi:photosystem II stability/assembly factor-like uncharacterized protein